MAEKRSTALHRDGVPLARAWIDLAEEQQRRRYEALPDSKSPIVALDEEASFWGRLLKVGGEWAVRTRDRKSAEEEMRDALVLRLVSKELEALGYRVEPEKSREPVRIEISDVRDATIAWDADAISVTGEEFRAVRIVCASARPTGRKRGRPGSNGETLRIIDDLIAESDGGFCGEPRGVACGRIIARAKEQFGARSVEGAQSGFSEKNLQKLILQRCPKRRISNN